MKRHVVRATAGAVLALTALAGSLPHRVAAATPPVGTLLLVAGTGEKGSLGDGGLATQARLNGPFGVAFDAAGNLCIGEMVSGRVRQVTPEGIITTRVRFSDVMFLAFDGAGNLFLTGALAGRVWKVSPEGVRTTLIGLDRAAIIRVQISPTGVAVDAAGNLFVANVDEKTGTGWVLKLTPEGIITTFAGGGTKPPQTADGGPATQAQLKSTPGGLGLAVDGVGNLFIGETYRVRRVSPDGIITPVAGTGSPGSSGDGGLATQAQLDNPTGLAVDSAGNLFIADLNAHRVRKVTPEGMISTVAGTGQGELSGVGGPATRAGLRSPQGLAVDAAGNLFIADTAWWDYYFDSKVVPSERVLEVVGVAAPGLIAGKPFPKQ